MRKLIGSIVFIVAGAAAWPATAQTGAAVVGKGPGVAVAARTVKVTATITAIDAATRAITLKGPQGREVSVIAGSEVKNFAQMKVGDEVNVEYREAVTLALKKRSTAPVGRTEEAEAGAAKAGERPAGVAGRRVSVIAEVVAVDAKTQTVTLRGPQRTIELKVTDPEQFKRVAKGDRVKAVYAEALAIAVTPAKK
jgi:Cu/Ag efflux protein CusF